jgi:hypothetical protein
LRLPVILLSAAWRFRVNQQYKKTKRGMTGTPRFNGYWHGNCDTAKLLKNH